jgi:phosphatidylserine decarboxylase
MNIDLTDMSLWKKVVIFIVIALCLFLAYFFRCPIPKLMPENEDVIYSPAYGRVMKIKHLKNDTVFIAIFLSPADIHYQFAPINGTVRRVTFDYTGEFQLAYHANKSDENEKCITEIQNRHGVFTIYQIAGFLVRRISNYLEPTKPVVTGERMGLIKFGSRVDMILPRASLLKLEVKEGDRVDGTNTVIGRYM